MSTVEGVVVLARRAGADIPELDEVAYAAIILTAESYVHDYARRGCVEQVQEVTPLVHALARALFDQGVATYAMRGQGLPEYRRIPPDAAQIASVVSRASKPYLQS
jgi:hypothetical protein